MKGFFKGVPERPGAAFVIVTHLSPERESHLHEVIEHYTSLPVIVAEDGMKVASDSVYVMPQNAILTMHNGHLKLRSPDAICRERKPIDIFLGSLADDQGEYAVGAILSGGDGDGTLGAKAIKERGGLMLAQSSDGSRPHNPDMPESAIASGMVDIALPVEQMGKKIAAFAQNLRSMSKFSADNALLDDDAFGQARDTIYPILRSQTGHDFSGYKTKTFVRRIKRRLQVLQLHSINDYIKLLKRDPAETINLFNDLLINVTKFFRDPDAFDVLENQALPKLFDGRGAGDVLRIWVPGCASGEEVYSIAILMREYLDKVGSRPGLQIFGTDIDDEALAIARAGRYSEQLLEDVSPERKERFFKKDTGGYVIDSQVRELCVFSPHSIIRDPPFSRMDLISCRNLLIYMGPELQSRVLSTFHYALKPGGFLFLGTSESISQHTELFSTIDKKNRLFQRRDHASTTLRPPILIGDQRISSPPHTDVVPGGVTYQSLRQTVETQVLERFSPAHVVVNADGNIVYFSAKTGKYLEPSQGAPNRQLLSMARKGLRLELRSALREVATSQSTVIRENVSVDEDGNHGQTVTLSVEPLEDIHAAEPLYLVLFSPTPRGGEQVDTGKINRPTDGTAQMERELHDMRDRLQSTIEEYETALEELKSSNEELVSVNEEAQSTNEELEASKEELQSLNEELNTINLELSRKVEELDRANSDLKNLFESTRVATVFLDRNLVIRNFTPASSAFFNLREADVGRPLTDLSSNLEYPELKEHIAAVFSSADVVEHKLTRDTDGKHYLVRLIPYLNDQGDTDGVVVTLVDVTTLAEAEEHHQVLIAELNHRVKNMLAVVISIANHTLETSSGTREFVNALNGRLHAMARSYELLSQSNWKNASVADLVYKESKVFDASRFNAIGSEVHLKPQQGLSVGMAIHELATNASKHGALKNLEGKINVSWNVKKGQFNLAWEEQGGPPVSQPKHEGFGLSLVKGEIEYRLGGKVETSFDPDGLKVRMSFGLDA
ncbi:chemotaxis protein CheB [Roseibium sp. LAB1]